MDRLKGIDAAQPALFHHRRTARLVWLVLCALIAGCYAPLHSPGIPASSLSDEYRWPMRTAAPPLNYACLNGPAQPTYLLGPGDSLQITAPDLIETGNSTPFTVQVLDAGEIYLPRLGPVQVGGVSLAEAQQRVDAALLSGGLLKQPGTLVTLAEKGTISVLVLGAVNDPGSHALPRFENDVAHALAAAGGFSEEAGDYIEIHRRGSCFPGQPDSSSNWRAPDRPNPTPPPTPMPPGVPVPGIPVPDSVQWNPGTHRYNTTTLPRPELSMPTPAGAQWNTGANRYSTTPASGAELSNPTPAGTQWNTGANRYHNTPASAVESSMPVPNSTQWNTGARRYHATPAPGTDSHAPVNSGRYGGHSLPVTIRGQSPDASFGFPADSISGENSEIVRIPLRGASAALSDIDVVLNPGDVVVVPNKTDKVFYVVGPLSEQNRVRFSVGDRDRQIGNGLLLPDDREIDVVTAVAMAGYIDPIESPTTVTVHRVRPDGTPILITVDLIEARCDRRETILVHAGDIIYLNPDSWWYYRRTMDRIIDRALGTAIGRWLTE